MKQKCNPVAKYATRFNATKAYKDRKKEAKSGRVKHKQRAISPDQAVFASAA
jgi:hypothetical protein